ncbi:hypothetical protein WMY93_034106, partial [Mugilogobius chulae]
VVGHNVTLFNITSELSKTSLECLTPERKIFFIYRDNKYMKDSQLEEYSVETPQPDQNYVPVILLNVTINHSGNLTCERTTTHEDGSENEEVFIIFLNVLDRVTNDEKEECLMKKKKKN